MIFLMNELKAFLGSCFRIQVVEDIMKKPEK